MCTYIFVLINVRVPDLTGGGRMSILHYTNLQTLPSWGKYWPPHPLQITVLITRTASVTSTPVLSASHMIIQISNVVQILKLQSKSNLIAASAPLNKDIDRYTTRRIWNHQKHENSLTFDFFSYPDKVSGFSL